jgi:3-phenylpropionate/trans-cinnamate dioxygenase ferredoxin component
LATKLLATDAEVPPDSITRVEVDGGVICLVRTPDGSLHAMDDACSHEGASLSEGELFESNIECAMHGSLFDLRTGAARGLPATDPIRTYRVFVDDGGIYIEI